ncbi:xanthine dehydrogenase small subunit [Nitrincola tapanii]|uniref:Xanthine dehydrogenase small subunit n=1 Tax=Nitrincola tapanii TaxID=1708751 RepID=A0A5A9W1Q0_9GAMM|nr:xanthine dehydrogenase small subunit [Nitrincola tapanii]KAA0874414.1 xanthine dehydrogenase small subunit [Nitrincola tapanii]
MIGFFLNQRWIEVDDVAPEMTLLQFLRTHLMHRGSKEGCASGDCGACTLVLAEPVKKGQGGWRLDYRSLNSCITYLGQVNGCQVITVEGLQAPDGRLHPVQQQMVEQHASQCGFCTPGFVMSLFALDKEKAKPSRLEVEEALSGNLCRCTGYRPILAAAQGLTQQPDHFTQAEAQVAEHLWHWRQQHMGALHQEDRAFLQPRDWEEWQQSCQAHPDARFLAGGTDLALETTQALRAFSLIDLSRLALLQQLRCDEAYFLIGAAVTYQQAHAFLTQHLPLLAKLMPRLGSRQIRNAGTFGGNIVNASPIGDTPPVLLALEAKLVFWHQGQEASCQMTDFFVAYRRTALPPSALLLRIEIPRPRLAPGQSQFQRVYKVSKRRDDDISAVCLALNLTLESGRILAVRIGLGGMAATPIRAYAAESALQGQVFDQAAVQAAQQALAESCEPLSDVRASAAYRLRLVQNLLQRALLEYEQGHSMEVDQYATVD